MSEPRIVTLIPSASEIVAALGLLEHIVGRSHECDFPPGIETRPALTRPRFPTDRPSAAIHESIRVLLDAALGVYALDAEALARLAPTHIVTQTQCEVCAVSLAQVEAAAAQLVGSKPRIVALAPMRLDDLFEDVRRVACAIDVAERAEALVASWRARLDAVRRAARPGAGARPRVACIEWCAPLMAAGNWVPEIVALAGGEAALGRAGAHAPVIAAEVLAQAEPDVLVFMPCGFDLARTEDDARTLLADKRLRRLRAVEEGRVFVTDGNAYFNRPGPRLVESVEIMAEILAPDRCRYGHEGTGFLPLRL